MHPIDFDKLVAMDDGELNTWLNKEVRLVIAGLPTDRRKKLERFHLEIQTSLAMLDPEERIPHLVKEMAINLKDMQLRLSEIVKSYVKSKD